MKILLVNMQFGRSYTQGTERYLATLGDCLRKRGHDISVLAGDPLGHGVPVPLGTLVDEEHRIHAYPTRGWMTVMGYSPGRVADWLRRHRPEIVHLNTPAHIGAGVMDACKRVGIPCVVTVHDFWWLCPKSTLLRPDQALCDATPGAMGCIRCLAAEHHRPWVRRLTRLPLVFSPATLAFYLARAARRRMSPADMLRWLNRRSVLTRCLDAAAHVVFPSRAIALAFASRLSHRRWRHIPNGLEARWFDNPKPAPEAPKPPEGLTVGYAGAMAPHKAPHLLLEAVRHLGWRNTRVALAGPPGEGPYWQRLKEATRGLNVELVGRLSPDEMPAFLRTLDILAIPSIGPENYPYVVLEAHAAGVPVVGSRIGGIPEQISDDRLLFEPGSVAGLAGALERARANACAWRPPVVHTAEEMTDDTEKIYRHALAGR